ncbi:glycoside hydrolase family 47 protein, partial [Tulasnella calospora MUT 4182]
MLPTCTERLTTVPNPRYFGGLLSAYAYTKDPQLLKKAKELGDTLLLALNTTSGYPKFSEYKYLAHLTGNKTYYEKVRGLPVILDSINQVEHIREMMHAQIDPTTNLLAAFWNIENGMIATRKFSIGALADSGYEYILKQYLLTGKTEKKALDMYLTVAQGIIDNLLYISPERGLLFATDIDGPGKGQPSYVYEHLSCFLPGLFALGAHSLDLSPEERQLHLWIADGLTQTCYISYADQTSGLGPEEMQFVRTSTLWYPQYKIWKKSSAARQSGAVPPGVKLAKDLRPEKSGPKRDYRNRRDAYLLRPETVESIFIMWRVTGDEVWRERGYEIFKAIERHTKT